MVFTRTPGGLSSQSKFYGAEIIAYIEGKKISDTDRVYDCYYYESIFQKYLSNKKVKIKVLGSCLDVLDFYYKIVDSEIQNSFAIIDRDYDGYLSTRIKDYRLLYTYGYSWENDFWSYNLCEFLLKLMTMNAPTVVDEFSKKISCAERRLSFIHKANLSFRINGISLFSLGKKGGNDGISVNTSSNTLITRKELGKFIEKARELDDLDKIIELMKSISGLPCRLIQGHYWEFLVLQTINSLIKKHSISKTTAPHETIKNIAFSHFSNSVDDLLSDEVKGYYRGVLAPFR